MTYNFSKLLYGSLCQQCLSGMQQPFTKWYKEFVTEILWPILSIHGKVNFLQLACYGNFCGQHYRPQSERDVDFLDFNIQRTKQQSSQRLVIECNQSEGNKLLPFNKFIMRQAWKLGYKGNMSSRFRNVLDLMIEKNKSK